MSADRYSEAYDNGMSLSAYLETLDPSRDHPGGLDAFQRLLRVAGIRTQTISEMGVVADEFGAISEGPDYLRALAPELVARMWRRAVTGRDASTRALSTSADQPSQLLNPTVTAEQVRGQQIAPAIPISSLVALRSGINSGAYEAFYLENETEELRMKRVVEGTEVPKAKLRAGRHTIRLKKFGRAIEITYEQLRRMKIDLLALHIARIAVQAEADKIPAISDVIVNGDGNPNTAALVYDLTDLDPAANVGDLTFKAWIRFLMKFKNPYMLTATLGTTESIHDMLTMDVGTANFLFMQLAKQLGFGGFRPLNQGLDESVGVGWDDELPASKLISIDARFAVEQVYEIGGNITEVQRWANRQTQELVMTEVEGFAKFEAEASKVLNLAA
jgi:hypothetical protein